jgi:hypothetical protein
MSDNLNNKFNNLDKDLQELILNKIYYKQNKDLLNDIENYNQIKNIIFKKYEKLGFIYNDDYTDDLNIYSRIENDLMAYYNNDYAYFDKSYLNNNKKINRLLVSKYKKNVFYNFHLNLDINIKSRINRYIACLNINERNDFIFNKSLKYINH